MSHFTTVRTEIRDLEILKKTLSDLGFGYRESVRVIGHQGRSEHVDLGVQWQDGQLRLGFKRDPSMGSYEIKGMRDFVRQEETKKIIDNICQEYAYRKVLLETRKRGFCLVQEERLKTGAIKIVLRKVA